MAEGAPVIRAVPLFSLVMRCFFLSAALPPKLQLLARVSNARYTTFSATEGKMRSIGFVIAPGFQMMSFAALSVFEFANLTSTEALYDVRLLSETGGQLSSSLGIPVQTHAFDDRIFDTLIVSGGLGSVPVAPSVVSFVQTAMQTSRRAASICTGAFVLAEPGILDAPRATTHWLSTRELPMRFPQL